MVSEINSIHLGQQPKSALSILHPINWVARDLNEAWHQAIYNLLTIKDGTHIYTIERGSYVGEKRLEFDYVTIHILYPGSRPLVPDTPPGIPPPSTMDYVESYLPYLMTNKPKPNEQYTYGTYLEPQIQKVIDMYKGHGGIDGKTKNSFATNQAYMAVGDQTSVDLPDPPCLRGIDTRILGGALHFGIYFRSWDLWAGFPSNLAAVQLLKEYMASCIGVNDGEMIVSSKGLHLYEPVWEIAKTAAGIRH